MARREDIPDGRLLRPLDVVYNDTNRGKSVLLEPPVGANATGEVKGILRVTTRCAAAEILGVQFAIRVPGVPADSTEGRDVNALVNPHVRARLEFGTGAVTNVADVDVLNGTQIGIIAEDLRVGAYYVKQSPEWDPDENTDAPDFEVTAVVGYHATGRNSNSARLTDLVMIEGNAEAPAPPNTKLIRVPDFAISFTIVPVGGQVISQAILSGYGAFTATYQVNGQLSNSGQNVENAFPIANGMRWLEITNTQAVGQAQYCYIIWGLAF